MRTYNLPAKQHGLDAHELLDRGLSFAALGIYAYLGSLIPGEHTTTEELITDSPDEQEEICRAVEDLVREGILEEVQEEEGVPA